MSSRSLKSSSAPLEDELENLYNELGALQRAVESKTSANVILREELKECQKERDKFRLMAESHLAPPKISQVSYVSSNPFSSVVLSGGSEGGTLAQLLSQCKEENKQLRVEITQLRCRLHDAQRDLKVLRDEKQHHSDYAKIRLSSLTSSQLAQQERESLLMQLEDFSVKCYALENDVRCLLEEREELVKERENIRHKLCRLNHMLNKLLSWNSKNSSQISFQPFICLDSLIVENRYLQQRIKQIKDEKCLALTTASKYKAALEKVRSTPAALKLNSGEKLILTPKQVSEFLDKHKTEIGEEEETDLWSLCIALVDALNQRSQAVKTQKAANKMLLERLTETEKRSNSSGKQPLMGSSIAPEENLVSESLMDGYNSSKAGVLPFCQVMSESTKLLSVANQLVSDNKSLICNDKIERSDKDSESSSPPETSKGKERLNSPSVSQLNSSHGKGSPVENSEGEQSSTLSETQLLEKNEDFDIEMSDYDSDNSNLDCALQDWQNEFYKNASKQSPKKKD